jgi:hypothetical protein
MGISVTSFLLGLGAAWVLPVVARVIRPVAVEATAAGMGLFEDARRVVAEQMETLEDIAAEARARREELLASGNGHHVEEDEASADQDDDAEPAVTGRARRRGAASRRRAS